jgi:hypothetical protein
MKLKFTGSGMISSYTVGEANLHPGDVHEFTKEEAEDLLATFPMLFEKVDDAKSEKMVFDVKNKKVTTAKNKSK